MKKIHTFITLFIFSFSFIISLILYNNLKINIEDNDTTHLGDVSIEAPPSILLFNYINQYSKEYNIPKNIAFGVAHKETGYNGPFHWEYNPKQSSYANAYGAMQIQVPTANMFSKKKLTKADLLNDLELNVKLSMEILRYLKNKYGSWELALGAYNTGKPIINQYAQQIVQFKYNNKFKNPS